jgi:hypothetical protein
MYQARELVAQRNVLGDEIGMVLDDGRNNREKNCELERHPSNHSLSPMTGKCQQLRSCIE